MVDSKPHAKRKDQLQWLASILLAVFVVCSGCSFFLGAGLVARGERATQVLGVDLRLWAIHEKLNVGLGFDRSFRAPSSGQPCLHHNVTILLWKPAVSLENVAYDDCS